MARSAKDWRARAVTQAELAESCEHAGMNLDAEMHAQLSQAAALISIAISVAKPERKS
jgi:hypothetical protein